MAQLETSNDNVFNHQIMPLYPIIYGYFSRHVEETFDAQDLTQETFLRAWSGLPAFRNSCPVKEWVFAIARNLYLDWEKSRRYLWAQRGSKQREDNQNDPADIVAMKMRLDDLVEAIGALEESRRITVLMRMDGHSFRDIGEAIGMSEPGARVKYFRVKPYMQRAMLAAGYEP